MGKDTEKGSRGVETGVALSTDTKMLAGQVEKFPPKESQNAYNCTETSLGSAEGIYQGIMDGNPPGVDILAPRHHSTDVLDDALENIIYSENFDDMLLGFGTECVSPCEFDGVSPGFEGNVEGNVGHAPDQPDNPGWRKDLPEISHTIVSNSLDGGEKTTHSLRRKQAQQKGLYERQERYRERKKNKAKETEDLLEEYLQKVEGLKKQNEVISRKNQSLLMMHSYMEDSINYIRVKSCKEKEKRADEGPKVNIPYQITFLGLGTILERIMGPFLEMTKEPGTSVLEKLASCVISNWSREARENCQIKIQEKLNAFLRHYHNASSQEVKDEYVKKMDILIQTRRRLADFMVQYHPEFVMARVMDGWVEEGFNPNLVGEDSIEIERSCITCLVTDLGLSKSQIEESNSAWRQFLSSWNNEVKVHNRLVGNLGRLTEWSSTYDRGIPTGIQASMEMRDGLNMLGDRSKSRAMLVLRLSNHLHSLLSPVQLGRLGIFYPAHTPNWLCVASVICRECK